MSKITKYNIIKFITAINSLTNYSHLQYIFLKTIPEQVYDKSTTCTICEKCIFQCICKTETAINRYKNTRYSTT